MREVIVSQIFIDLMEVMNELMMKEFGVFKEPGPLDTTKEGFSDD